MGFRNPLCMGFFFAMTHLSMMFCVCFLSPPCPKNKIWIAEGVSVQHYQIWGQKEKDLYDDSHYDYHHQ